MPTSDSVLPPVASHVSRVLYTPVGSHKRVAFSWFLPNLKMGWPCTVIGCVALSSKPTSRPICFKATAWSREATRWLRGTASAAAHNESIPSLLPPEVRGCLIRYGPRGGVRHPRNCSWGVYLPNYLPTYLPSHLLNYCAAPTATSFDFHALIPTARAPSQRGGLRLVRTCVLSFLLPRPRGLPVVFSSGAPRAAVAPWRRS